MQTVVAKFGGPAIATAEKIRDVAKNVIKEQARGIHLVVVVSSMESIRRELRQFAHDITDEPSKREMDVLIATGAQMTSALLTMAIQELGGKAISLAGWQAGIKTNDAHRNARVEDVDVLRIKAHLAQGEIVVVSGFQGITEAHDITTLGKGGSETSAVALAVALEAERVDIYSNVDGIFTADPQIVEHARMLPEISYDEMLEFANLGAHILHPRAVELAKKYELPLVIRSFEHDVDGTLIKGDVEMEKNLIVRSVAYESDIIRLTIGYDSYETASLAEVFHALAEHEINVDIIVQAVIDGIKPTISFTIAKEEFAESLRVLEASKLSLGFSFADFEVGLAKVSIVGSGMVSNPGVAARMFARLGKENIPVKMVSTSEIKVSVVVPQDEMVRAANALHDEFNLAILEISAS
ncbi:aspartate kinase [Solibacillus daqui]|uniref:aspartate kinase n=1 Tax=Solibacillus daqui TaxID=2912187 RepID=UPI002366687C|nr:aspartate kinase [Solibacillus daqui]